MKASPFAQPISPDVARHHLASALKRMPEKERVPMLRFRGLDKQEQGEAYEALLEEADLHEDTRSWAERITGEGLTPDAALPENPEFAVNDLRMCYAHAEGKEVGAVASLVFMLLLIREMAEE